MNGVNAFPKDKTTVTSQETHPPIGEETKEVDEETLQLPPKGLKNPENPQLVLVLALLLRAHLSLCHRKTLTEPTE